MKHYQQKAQNSGFFFFNFNPLVRLLNLSSLTLSREAKFEMS